MKKLINRKRYRAAAALRKLMDKHFEWVYTNAWINGRCVDWNLDQNPRMEWDIASLIAKVFYYDNSSHKRTERYYESLIQLFSEVNYEELVTI
jgi:hypothetical protein